MTSQASDQIPWRGLSYLINLEIVAPIISGDQKIVLTDRKKVDSWLGPWSVWSVVLQERLLLLRIRKQSVTSVTHLYVILDAHRYAWPENRHSSPLQGGKNTKVAIYIVNALQKCLTQTGWNQAVTSFENYFVFDRQLVPNVILSAHFLWYFAMLGRPSLLDNRF